MKPPKISSGFALLDVMQGRKALAKYIKTGAEVPIVIHADIVHQWSGDDGTSIEFELRVNGLEFAPVAIEAGTGETRSGSTRRAKARAAGTGKKQSETPA